MDGHSECVYIEMGCDVDREKKGGNGFGWKCFNLDERKNWDHGGSE